MLTKLTVKNLKCFNETVEIPLSSLNLIYGENSSGKSTIILALQILRRSLLEQPTHQKEYPFKGIIYNHDTKREITIGLSAYRYGGRVLLPSRVEDALDGYSFSSTLAWSEENRKADSKNLKITQILDEYFKDRALTWNFINQSNDMVVPINISTYDDDKYKVDLIYGVTAKYRAVLEGVEKRIEADIMNDFFDENDEEYESYLSNYSDRLGLEKEEEAEKALQEWRQGVPDWIKECPPSWNTYRKSAEFIKKAEDLRATKYKDVIHFYESVRAELIEKAEHLRDTKYKDLFNLLDNRSKEYFASNPAKIILREGDLSRIHYEPSQILVNDTIGILDAELEFVDLEGDVKLKTIPRSAEAQEASALRDTIDRAIPSTFQTAASDIQEILRRIVVVAPLRERAERIYSSVSISPGIEQPDIDGATVPLMLKEDEQLLERTNEWLAKLGVDYAIEIHPIDDEYFKLLLRDTRNDDAPLVQYADVGFGISQILPIVVACLSSRPSIILIEQPELHIHPRLQAELGSLFAEAMHKHRHQLIVETHSEHLMLRIQRLIRKKETYPSSVNVLYVSRGSSGSSVQRLELNEDAGFLDAWPSGFFPERLQELL